MIENLLKNSDEFRQIVSDLTKKITSQTLVSFDLQLIFRKLATYAANQFDIENELIKKYQIAPDFASDLQKSQEYFLAQVTQICEDVSLNLWRARSLLFFLISWLDSHEIAQNSLLINQISLIENEINSQKAYEILTRNLNNDRACVTRYLNGILSEIISENSAFLDENLQLKRELSKKTKELYVINSKISTIQTNDAVTGLPSRRYAIRTISSLIKQSKNLGGTFGVIFINFNEFEDINERVSLDVAKKAMALIADILRDVTRSDDVVCSLGKQEFALICPDCEQSGIINLTNAIKSKMQFDGALKEYISKLENLGVTVSFGVTIADGNCDIKDILKQTDFNLHEAKSAKWRVEITSFV